MKNTEKPRSRVVLQDPGMPVVGGAGVTGPGPIQSVNRPSGAHWKSGLSCHGDFAKVRLACKIAGRAGRSRISRRRQAMPRVVDDACMAPPWRQSLASLPCAAAFAQGHRWQRPLCQPSSPADRPQGTARRAFFGFSQARCPAPTFGPMVGRGHRSRSYAVIDNGRSPVSP